MAVLFIATKAAQMPLNVDPLDADKLFGGPSKIVRRSPVPLDNTYHIKFPMNIDTQEADKLFGGPSKIVRRSPVPLDNTYHIKFPMNVDTQ